MKRIRDAELKNLSGFGCAGRAKELIEVKRRTELAGVIEELNKKKIPWRVLGKGFNLLISGRGYQGAVILLRGEFESIKLDGSFLRAGAGADLQRTVQKAAENSLSGLEFLAGIPGTVGGALKGNSGSKNDWIGSAVERVEVFINGAFRFMDKGSINFSYRRCDIQPDGIIVSCEFKLKRGNETDIIKKIHKLKKEKRKRQPIQYKSCGCVFKNPKGFSAGKIIDSAGMSGFSQGDARVSEKHANFIINMGNASPEDIWKLIKRIKDTVRRKKGIELELEIDLMGDGFE